MKNIWSLFIVVALMLFTVACYSQNRSGNVWCFGYYNEISFNSGSPVQAGPTQMASMSGTTSIADSATGLLLFYTDGIHVWDTDNNIMPGNTSPLGALQSFGGSNSPALIVPKPGNSKQYYIFTTGATLSYSIVDMTLHGGLGDLAQQPAPLLSDSVSVLSGTIMTNGGGYWLVTHTHGNSKFYVYPITASGIGTPVISSQGSTDNGDTFLKVSPDGTKVSIVLLGATTATAEVCGFNKGTGAVSAPFFTDNTLPNINTASTFGLSFSPNSKLLYISVTFDSVMYQYNLAAGNQGAIMASKYGIATTYNTGPGNSAAALQIGPDRKLYVGIFDSYQLDVIAQPDVPGPDCQYQANAITVTGNCMAGLVNFMDYIFVEGYSFPLQIITNGTSVICGNTCSGTVSVTAFDGKPPYHYQWSTGAATTNSMNNLCAGTYQITVTDSTGATVSNSYTIVYDTSRLRINISNFNNNLASDSQNCTNQVVLSIPDNFNSFTWSDGDTYYQESPSLPGLYWVTVIDSNNCPLISDSVYVHQSPPFIEYYQHNDTIVVFPANGVSLQWYYNYNNLPVPGQTSDTFFIAHSGGVYYIASDTNGCEVVGVFDGVGITTVRSDDITIYPNPSPNGHWELNIQPYLSGSAYEVSDIVGQIVYRSTISSTVSDIYLDVPPGDYLLHLHSRNGDRSAILVRK